MLQWVLGAMLVAALAKGKPKLFHLEKGRCYVWTYRYSPRLTDSEWDQVVSFHRQFFDPSPSGLQKLNLMIDRARQTIRFDLTATESRDVPRETRDQPVTYLPHMRSGIRVSTRVDDCDLPSV